MQLHTLTHAQVGDLLGVVGGALAGALALVGDLGVAGAGDGAELGGLPAEVVVGGALGVNPEQSMSALIQPHLIRRRKGGKNSPEGRLASGVLVAKLVASIEGIDELAGVLLPELAVLAWGGLDAAVDLVLATARAAGLQGLAVIGGALGTIDRGRAGAGGPGWLGGLGGGGCDSGLVGPAGGGGGGGVHGLVVFPGSGGGGVDWGVFPSGGGGWVDRCVSPGGVDGSVGNGHPDVLAGLGDGHDGAGIGGGGRHWSVRPGGGRGRVDGGVLPSSSGSGIDWLGGISLKGDFVSCALSVWFVDV